MKNDDGISSDYEAIRSAFLRWLDSQNIGTQDVLALMVECIVAKLLHDTDSEANFRECMYVMIENLVSVSKKVLEQIKK